jgi:hypothetical protein
VPFACVVAITTMALFLGGTTAAAQADDPVIAAAGDIACDPASGGFNGGAGTSTSCRQGATSNLLLSGVSAVLPLGDNQYDCGGLNAYAQSYDPSWGRVKSITRPVPGNHEYTSSGTGCDPAGAAAGYFGYFGTAAGDPASGGYYSFNIGQWHLIALNSNCSKVAGCGVNSPQEQWLRQDLTNNHSACTLAYWHHPLFSSGQYRPGVASTRPLFQALYDFNADVVLSGHDHNYERFAPQAPNGSFDPARGIREFIVGTGGKSLYATQTPVANSEVRNSHTFGVLKLTLHPTSYEWSFVPVAGGTFRDYGAEFCDGLAGQYYPRPRSGTPVTVELVPAFEACTSPNGVHGAPRAVASCNPPRPISTRVTMGTADSNGKQSNFTGSLTLKIIGENPINLSNGDQADVSISTSLNDVRSASTLADYTGQLQGQLLLRITDRSNGPALDRSATVTDVPLSFPIQCRTTASNEIGSSCNLTTTADSLMGGVAKEAKRSVWELLDVRVLDGGPDGVASTADNSLFVVQGLFAP